MLQSRTREAPHLFKEAPKAAVLIGVLQHPIPVKGPALDHELDQHAGTAGATPCGRDFSLGIDEASGFAKVATHECGEALAVRSPSRGLHQVRQR